MSRGREINILQIGMVCTVLLGVLLVLSFVALGVGSAGYSPSQIVQALLYDESGHGGDDDFAAVSDTGFFGATVCFWRCGTFLCADLPAGLARRYRYGQDHSFGRGYQYSFGRL